VGAGENAQFTNSNIYLFKEKMHTEHNRQTAGAAVHVKVAVCGWMLLRLVAADSTTQDVAE